MRRTNVFLVGSTLLAACDGSPHYQTVEDCVNAGHAIEQCQPRHSGGGYVYVPHGFAGGGNSDGDSSRAQTSDAGAATSARGGFGETGAAHGGSAGTAVGE